MIIVLLRTIILYIIVMVSMRIMGKRQLGELQPYELVVTIMISELASLPMQDTRIPLLHGAIPIVTLLLIQILISLAEIKSMKARSIFDGKPSIVINKGKIVIPELKNQLFTINDLMEELRILGYFNVEDIEYGILETNGELSIIPKGAAEPPTRQDMNIQSQEKTLPTTIIMEGRLFKDNLKLAKKDEKWLKNQLDTKNIKNISDVFLAIMSSENTLLVQQYKDCEQIGEVDI